MQMTLDTKVRYRCVICRWHRCLKLKVIEKAWYLHSSLDIQLYLFDTRLLLI